jgi:hypothetical protein
LPGIFDTKGTQQEIANSLTNSLVFKKGRPCRMVIVVEKASLDDRRGGTLADTLVGMERLFGPGLAHLAKSSCLVLSKVDSAVFSNEDVLEQLSEIIKYNEYFAEGTVRRSFVEEVITNQQVHTFPIPKELTP